MDSSWRPPQQRFEQPRAFARRAPAGFAQSIAREFEAAVFAPRRNDLDDVAGGDGGTHGVPQILFDVAAPEAEQLGERGRRAGLVREQLDQLAPNRSHVPIVAKADLKVRL